MTATVTDLAPVIAIDAPRLLADARRGELERLASAAGSSAGPSAYVLRIALRALVHPSISDGEAGPRWLDFLDAVRLRDDVEDGLVTWAEIYPELLCEERQEVARELTRQGAWAALDVLVHGERGSR